MKLNILNIRFHTVFWYTWDFYSRIRYIALKAVATQQQASNFFAHTLSKKAYSDKLPYLPASASVTSLWLIPLPLIADDADILLFLLGGTPLLLNPELSLRRLPDEPEESLADELLLPLVTENGFFIDPLPLVDVCSLLRASPNIYKWQ